MEASVTLLEATTPVKLPTKRCPRYRRVRPRTAKGPYFKDGSTTTGVADSKPPAYPTRRMAKVSGLKEAIRVLDGVEDIQICRLTPADVVRHVLVQRIVAAYDKYEKNRLPDERARTFTKKPDWKREKK